MPLHTLNAAKEGINSATESLKKSDSTQVKEQPAPKKSTLKDKIKNVFRKKEKAEN